MSVILTMEGAHITAPIQMVVIIANVLLDISFNLTIMTVKVRSNT